ncbi:MAG TPA: HEAT repeat domain-containing protein [Saprospiraceae bacterium]|nr:HEAT repeat domain-containing protein [Saprospiraceae bacterium]
MFDIRMGEFRRVWLMLINVFLLIQCLWIIKPVANSQFLSTVGIEKLPLVFLLVAVTALALSSSYSKLLHKLPLGRIMKRTYVISILCLLIFAMMMEFHLFEYWMSYLFYIGVAIFGLITTSQFWLLGNVLFSSLEAKRLFGFIGAGAIAGGISGGYITTLLAQFMNSNLLLFVAAALLIVSMIINQQIITAFVPSLNNAQVTPAKNIQEYPLRLIRNSKHLSYLALIMGISVVVAKLIEFQFSAIASESISDPDKLTAFFGFWFSTSNAVALGIQLLVTQRIVAFLGVGRSLFVLPGALFMGTLAVLNTPVLWASTSLKLLDISLKQSINKAATELLILPVPLAIKSQAKTYIDVFVDTTATGIGGIMLIFLVNGLNLSVRAVCIMVLALISLWIYLAVRVRNEYVLAFQKQLGINPHSRNEKDLVLSNTSVASGMRLTLKSGTTKQILFVLQSIEESKDPRLMPDVIPLLNHESPRVRHAALSCLYYHTDHSITRLIEPLLKDPDDIVRSRAFSCLLAHTRLNRVQFINDYLKDPDPAISGAAIVGLATETRDNPKMQQQFFLEEHLLENISKAGYSDDPEDLVTSKINVARAIGYGKILTFYPMLNRFLKDENPGVLKHAILAAGNTQDPNYVKPLLNFLLDESTRATAQKALAKYKPAEILPILADISNDRNTSTEMLIQLPALAETMDTQQAIDFLFELLVQHHPPSVKLEVLEVLHTVKAKFPHLTISGKRITSFLMHEADLYKDTLALSYAAQQSRKNKKEDPAISQARNELIELLEGKLDHNLKRIFWLLGLNYPPGMILPLFDDLRHKDQEKRISTVELLDNILEPSYKKVVISIVETAMLDNLSSADMSRLELRIPTENSCFESLLKGKDDVVKIAVLKLIEAMKNPKLDHLIQMAAEDEHDRVKNYAERMLEKEGLETTEL